MTTAHFDLAQAFLEGNALDQRAIRNLVKALKASNQLATARCVLDKAAASPTPTESRDAEAAQFTAKPETGQCGRHLGFTGLNACR